MMEYGMLFIIILFLIGFAGSFVSRMVGIGGVWTYRKGGYLNKSLISYMGVSILLGSLIGALGSNLMT